MSHADKPDQAHLVPQPDIHHSQPQVGQPQGDHQRLQAGRQDETAAVAHAHHDTTATQAAPLTGSAAHESPRDFLPEWKWKVMLLLFVFLSILSGYDTSNIATLQVPIYEAFRDIKLLPWVGLAYSTANVAVVPLIRKLSGMLDLKMLMISNIIIFIVGAAVTGSAQNMDAVIVGRIINGIGAAGCYQLILSYVALFGKPAEVPKAMGIIGMGFAVGLITGPLIGAGFAENEHATWRWALYYTIPVCGLCILGSIIALPSYRVPSSLSLKTQLARLDWVGCLLHIATFVLLGLALTFSGVVWDWESGSTKAIWVMWGVTLIAYVAQQSTSSFTTPKNRIFPGHLLKHRMVGLAALGTTCVGTAYAVTLYYTPLFFAFTRGLGAIPTAVRLLPYLCVFIASVVLAGALLPVVRRVNLFYLLAGALLLVGGGLLTSLTPTTSESRVMGYEAVLGFGLGLVFHHGVSVANAALPPSERLNSAALMNMAQLGSVSVSLGIAGCVFQNLGHDRLAAAMRPFGFSDTDVREALAGVASPIFAAGPAVDRRVVPLAVAAVTSVIADLFYLNVAAGAVCLAAALLMRWDKLVFARPPAEDAAVKA